MLFDIKGGFALPMYFPTRDSFGSGAWWKTFTIAAAGQKIAFIFRAPKTGTIDFVGFLVRAVTNSQTLKASLETVNPATGHPTGTLIGAGASGTQAAPAANTFYEIPLSTPQSVTANDYIALVIEFDSTGGNLDIAAWDTQTSTGDYAQFPFCDHFVGSWAKGKFIPIASIKYGETEYPFNGMLPIKNQNEIAVNTGSTPDEVGMKFQLPAKTRIKGLWLFIYLREPLTLKLYDENDTLLDSVAFDPDITTIRQRGGIYGYLILAFSLMREKLTGLPFCRQRDRIFLSNILRLPTLKCLNNSRPTKILYGRKGPTPADGRKRSRAGLTGGL